MVSVASYAWVDLLLRGGILKIVVVILPESMLFVRPSESSDRVSPIVWDFTTQGIP